MCVAVPVAVASRGPLGSSIGPVLVLAVLVPPSTLVLSWKTPMIKATTARATTAIGRTSCQSGRRGRCAPERGEWAGPPRSAGAAGIPDAGLDEDTPGG